MYCDPVGSPALASQSLEAALEEVAVPIVRVDGKDALDGLPDRPASEEHLAYRIRPTQTGSLAGQENTVRGQIAIILALVGHAVVRLFVYAGRPTESSLDTKVMEVIRAVVNRLVSKAFQSSVFQNAVKRAVHNSLVGPHVTCDVTTRTIDLPAFTVPVPKICYSEE